MHTCTASTQKSEPEDLGYKVNLSSIVKSWFQAKPNPLPINQSFFPGTQTATITALLENQNEWKVHGKIPCARCVLRELFVDR